MAQFESLPTEKRDKLSKFKFDTMRVDTLNEWAYQLKGDSVAKQYVQIALAYAQKIGYREGVSDSHQQLGVIAAMAGDDALAEKYFRMALSERQALKLTAKMAGSYNQLGFLSRRQRDYETAIDLYRRGLALMKRQPPHINTVYLYSGLGTANRLGGHYEQADSAFQSGLRLYPQLIPSARDEKTRNEYKEGLASLRMHTGSFLQEQLYRYKAAKDSLFESWADFKSLGKPIGVAKCLLLLGNNAYLTRDLDTAKAYYEQGLAMKDSIKKSDYHLLLKNRGRVFLDQRKYKAARTDFQAALQGFAIQLDTPNIADTQFEIGNFYYEQSQLDSAVKHYQLALANDKFDDALQKGRLL